MTDAATQTSANDFIEQALNQRLSAIETAFDADGLCIVGPIYRGLDGYVRKVVEELQQKEPQRDRLVVLLTTYGGYIEVVQRIVETIRHRYNHVAFVIPDNALSAGTVLAMSGDEIWMNYYSRLGPIDPQVRSKNGRWVPALGYVREWEKLLEKAQAGKLSDAEYHLMVEGFDQGELYQWRQSRALSVRLLRDWLVNYKFKNWEVTETHRTPVTHKMRADRAEAIALTLNDTERWHSHGQGIPMSVLTGEEIKLIVNDLDEDEEKGAAVKEYDGLLTDYMMRLGDDGILHTVHRYLRVM